MKFSEIQQAIRVLATSSPDALSYENFIEQNKNQQWWAVQVALMQCYRLSFEFGPQQNIKLCGNQPFFIFQACLEQQFEHYINQYLLVPTKQWDFSGTADEFIIHLEKMICNHATFQHPFFTDFLTNKASFDDMRFYLAQETLPRFDDLLAMIQIGSPMQMKIELAKNYWDEMGNGIASQAHTTMFAKVKQYFKVTETFSHNNILASSLVSDNLSAMLALYREHYAKAIGFQAVTEFCVPHRFKYFIKGCRRIGVPEDILAYHILHTDIDGEHAQGWFQEIVKPLVVQYPESIKHIIQGAELKLNSSQYFFDGIIEQINKHKLSMAEII